MADRPEKTTREAMEGPGIYLRRAREKRGLQLHDIAQELHLDEWMLQALEEDDFVALGAPVFAKGHMRKYGSMLGLNTDDLMIAYYRKRGRDDSPPPITKMMAPERPDSKMSMRGLGWILAALVAVVALIAVWALLTSGPASNSAAPIPAAPTSTTQVPPQQLPVEPVELPGESVEPAAQTPAVSLPREQGSVAEQPSASGNVNSATPASRRENNAPSAPDIVAASPSIEVRLTLTGESWVEVTDSDGKRLVYDMMSAGRTRTVSGRPPIEVFLGNSRSVQLSVGGQVYAIPRRAVRGNTARFVIEPDSR